MAPYSSLRALRGTSPTTARARKAYPLRALRALRALLTLRGQSLRVAPGRTLRAWPLHRRELWKPHGSLQLLTGLTSLTRLIKLTARGQQEAKRPGKGPKWGGPHETPKPLKNSHFHEENSPILRAL